MVAAVVKYFWTAFSESSSWNWPFIIYNNIFDYKLHFNWVIAVWTLFSINNQFLFLSSAIGQRPTGVAGVVVAVVVVAAVAVVVAVAIVVVAAVVGDGGWPWFQCLSCRAILKNWNWAGLFPFGLFWPPFWRRIGTRARHLQSPTQKKKRQQQQNVHH